MTIDVEDPLEALDADSDQRATDLVLFEVDGPAGPLPRHLSPSSATLFTQCPRRWRLRYIDRIAEPAGAAAVIGTFAHRVLEVLLGEAPEHRTQDRAKLIATTEVTTVRNGAALESMQSYADRTGLKVIKTWINSADARVRARAVMAS